MNVVDDERHLVFECPAFEFLRVTRRGLFSAWVGLDMKRFMNQRNQQDRQGVFWHIIQSLKEADELANIDRSSDVDVGVAEQYDTYE